jgi:hypothetical protein
MNLKTFLTLFTTLFLVSCASKGKDISLPEDYTFNPDRREYQTEAPGSVR